MKLNINFNKELPQGWFLDAYFKSSLLFTFLMIILFTTVKGQDVKYTKPSLWIGAAAGANVNFYNGSTQTLNSDLIVPVVFTKGTGIGLYAAPLIEFYRPGSVLGVMLQAGYDDRSAKFDMEKSPCNCPRDLSTKLTYITIEPSLRIAPFRSNFYLYVGPRLAYNLDKSFIYKQGPNPDYPEQVAEPDVKGDFDNVNKMILSMQVGAGYDVHLSADEKRTQVLLSPFVSFHPYFGQNPRSTETLNITTVRVGAALKFGRGREIESQVPPKVVAAIPEVKLSVATPVNVPVVKSIRETFPVRNYIFFDTGSTAISDRYVLITKEQVKDFKEDHVEDFGPKNSAGRSARQMKVYYNVINILGDRMVTNPTATVTLVGSSQNGAEEGKLMAQSVKKYLVDVFGVNATRISIEGREQPKLPSESPGATRNLDLLREGDRRVSIESNTPSLLMEFQSGNTAPLKPIEIVTINATIDSNFSCTIDGNCTSWSLEVMDQLGKIQKYGPYYEQKVSIPNNLILGSKSEGNYKITMIGTTLGGQTIKTDTTIHLVKWVAPKIEEVMRFSILYEFDDNKAIKMYEKYLTDIVVPKIPIGGTVFITGFTDIIGEEGYNLDLSQARANDVKRIMESALSNLGRTDVKFEANGFGEDERFSPFDNKYPEERFYNRTVIIDIISVK